MKRHSAGGRGPCPNALRRNFGAGLAVLVALLAMTPEARAQVDCRRLQAQLALPDRGNDQASAQRYRSAADKQRGELDRTIAYANSLGCGRQQFLMFGSPPPPQCDGIEVRMRQMRVNLDQLQAQAQRLGGGDTQRRQMAQLFDTNCRGLTRPGDQRERGLFDTLFGGGGTRTLPLDPDEDNPENPMEEVQSDPVPRGGPKAVCVRTCDGAFFPVSYSATQAKMEGLSELCQALCPNAETKLFTYSLSRDIDQAVGTDGDSYASLPNAGRYRTKFDPACACKPRDKSWSEVLAEAERVLGASKDVVLSAEKAEELSRARPPKPVQAKTPPPAKGKGAAKSTPVAQPAVQPEQSEIDSRSGREAPTAGNQSSGIAEGSTTVGAFYGLADGQTREQPIKGGFTKRVRVIAPSL